ncbi:MAG: DUF2809 domain-containing protein [Anaerolineae bacterium]|nr:DUF2809 domain-containing protein [Anaerolineae bacterium]
MKLHFSKKYALVFTVLLLIEIGIALYIKDHIIRPLAGDMLVVVLMYACVRMFLNVRNPKLLAIGVLLFAYSVELSQAFNLVSRLGLANSKFATIVMGTTFDWRDLLAYTIGFVIIWMERRIS